MNHGHDEGGGRSEAGADRRIAEGAQLEGYGAAAVVVANHVPVHGGVQCQLPVENADIVQMCRLLALLVGRHEPHARLVKRLEHGVGVAVDGGVEHVTAIHVGIRGNVGAAAGQAEAEGRARSDDHAWAIVLQ